MTYAFNGTNTPVVPTPVAVEAPEIVQTVEEGPKTPVSEVEVILIPEVDIDLGVESSGEISAILRDMICDSINVYHTLVDFEKGNVTRKKEVAAVGTALRNAMLPITATAKGLRGLILDKKKAILSTLGDERIYLRKESLEKRMAKLKQEMADLELREAEIKGEVAPELPELPVEA